MVAAVGAVAEVAVLGVAAGLPLRLLLPIG